MAVTDCITNGEFAKRPEWLIEPQDILSIIDFAYNKIGGKLLIVLADCIGYYSNKDIKVMRIFLMIIGLGQVVEQESM